MNAVKIKSMTPKSADSKDESVAQEEEKKQSDAECIKIELHCLETNKQRTMNCQIQDRIWHMNAAQRPEIIAL